MTKFTDEEKSLCKQVAERYRKEIEYGDWLLNEGGFAKVWPYRLSCKRIDVIPLWTISDCVDFLRERGCNNYLYFLHHEKPHEACLKAVLAILKED